MISEVHAIHRFLVPVALCLALGTNSGCTTKQRLAAIDGKLAIHFDELSLAKVSRPDGGFAGRYDRFAASDRKIKELYDWAGKLNQHFEEVEQLLTAGRLFFTDENRSLFSKLDVHLPDGIEWDFQKGDVTAAYKKKLEDRKK